MMLKKTLLLCLFSFTIVAHAAFTDHPPVKQFIQHMVQKHHFSESELEACLNQVTIQTEVLTAIAKPAESKPWKHYQTVFLTPERIEQGVVFWQTHAQTLKKAQEKFGVPPEIIIAIIGVETFYGKRTGQYPVLDSLATLAFHYPPRATFFLSELEEFLLLAREEKWDPKQIKGSYAGAMGTPQFIASSYRRYAIDFSGQGQRNLLTNTADAIGSVSHYFKVHGWQPGQPVVFAAQVEGEKFKTIVASKANPKPSHTLQQLPTWGVRVNETKEKTHPYLSHNFALLSLEGHQGTEYWLGAQNFYVITRYNHSDHYAMAAYLLSEKIKAAYEKTAAKARA